MIIRASSSASNRCSHNDCSFSVRMKRIHDAIALGLAHERRAMGDAKPRELVPKGIGGVLGTPVTADREAARHLRPERAEGRVDAPVDRFQRRPAIADLGDMPAHDVGTSMINGPEEPAPAVARCVEPRRVGAPHHVRSLRRDRARVGGVPMPMSGALRREERAHAHQPQDAVAADSQAACRSRTWTLRWPSP